MRLTKILMTRGLTAVNHQAAASFVGMAHFAGTGPEGKTCGECYFWANGNPSERLANRRVKPRACAKYRQLAGREGTPVPHHAGACRYFLPTHPPERQGHG
jgi:hypothetical protein